MKKSLLILFTLFAVSITAGAQKFALIDMEYILENIPAYERANEQLEQSSRQWQSEVEKISEEAKTLYNEIYNAVKEIATQNGYAAVVDRASASSIIFASPSIDVSNEVLAKLGYSN